MPIEQFSVDENNSHYYSETIRIQPKNGFHGQIHDDRLNKTRYVFYGKSVCWYCKLDIWSAGKLRDQDALLIKLKTKFSGRNVNVNNNNKKRIRLGAKLSCEKHKDENFKPHFPYTPYYW